MSINYDLGAVSSYGLAVQNGFTGTVQEWVQAITDASQTYNDLRSQITALGLLIPSLDSTLSDNNAAANANAVGSAINNISDRVSVGETTVQSFDTRMSSVEANIQSHGNRLDAEENATAVLEGRMDEFSTLTDGSTTGDAELADIRVGADGTTYSNAGNAVRGQISNVKQDLQAIIDSGAGMSEDFKQALHDILEKVAYINGDGQDYLDALDDAMWPPVPPATLTSITCVYTQSGAVYETDTLDSLKSDLVVTAHYDNGTSQVVTTYTLSGTLAEGTSTITVAYEGKTTTFAVTVSSLIPSGYTRVSAIAGSSQTLNANEIDTDYYINSNSIFEIKGIAKHTSNVASFFTDHSANGYGFGYQYSQNKWISYRGGTQYSNSNTPAPSSNDNVFVVYANNAIAMNGDVFMSNVADGNKTSGNTMKILGDGASQSILYYMKVYENDVLVANYLPCIREADDMVGVYDTVGHNFFGNGNLTSVQ